MNEPPANSANPLLTPGPDRSRRRRSLRFSPSISVPPSTPRLPKSARKSPPSPPIPNPPSFANTIEALERSGAALDRVASVFFNLAAPTAMRRWRRSSARSRQSWRAHQQRNLSERGAVRPHRALHAAQGEPRARCRTGAGACALSYRLRAQWRGACARTPRRGLPQSTSGLPALGAQFGQNVLADEKAYRAGPGDAGGSRGPAATRCSPPRRRPPPSVACQGKHGITLSRSSIEPFLQFSARRDLREKAFRAWTARGENGGATDNRAIAAEMVRLARRAGAAARLCQLRAFPPRRYDGENAAGGARPAAFGLDAGAARRRCAMQAALQALVAEEGGNFPLAPWDWRYYAEKRRKALFDLDEGEIKPYLQLDKMIEAAFLRREPAVRPDFRERKDIAALSSRRAMLDGDRARRQGNRAVHRRLFCAAVKAQRRLDERLPRAAASSAAPCARSSSMCMNFAKARRRRGLSFELRRRAHAVP